MYNPLLVKQASPVSDSRMAGTSSIWGWPRTDKNPFAFIDRSWPSSAPIEMPRYPWAGGNPAPVGPQANQPSTGRQPQSQQQSNDPEWSGMYGKDAWRDYQMHKKYMNDPDYKAFTEWYNQNKGRYGTPQQPQQPAGGIQPGQGWQIGPFGTGGQPGGWSPTRNRPNPDFNPASTGIWPHKGNMPYITPEGELTDSPYGGQFKPKSGVMGGVFGGSGPGMSWEDTRRALMM